MNSHSPKLQFKNNATTIFTISLISSVLAMGTLYFICQKSLIDFSWTLLGLTAFFILSLMTYNWFNKRGQIPRFVKILCIPTSWMRAMSPIILSISTWLLIFLIPLIFIILSIASISAYTYRIPADSVFQWSCFLTIVLVSTIGERLYDKLFSPYVNPEYFDFGKKLFTPAQTSAYFYLYAFVVIMFDQHPFTGLIGGLIAYFRLINSAKGFSKAYQQISNEYCELLVQNGLMENPTNAVTESRE